MKSPSELNWLVEKQITKKEMFENELGNNEMNTKIIRLLGWLFMNIGIYLFFSPIYQIL